MHGDTGEPTSGSQLWSSSSVAFFLGGAFPIHSAPSASPSHPVWGRGEPELLGWKAPPGPLRQLYVKL